MTTFPRPGPRHVTTIFQPASQRPRPRSQHSLALSSSRPTSPERPSLDAAQTDHRGQEQLPGTPASNQRTPRLRPQTRQNIGPDHGNQPAPGRSRASSTSSKPPSTYTTPIDRCATIRRPSVSKRLAHAQAPVGAHRLEPRARERRRARPELDQAGPTRVPPGRDEVVAVPPEPDRHFVPRGPAPVSRQRQPTSAAPAQIATSAGGRCTASTQIATSPSAASRASRNNRPEEDDTITRDARGLQTIDRTGPGTRPRPSSRRRPPRPSRFDDRSITSFQVAPHDHDVADPRPGRACRPRPQRIN